MSEQDLLQGPGYDQVGTTCPEVDGTVPGDSEVRETAAQPWHVQPGCYKCTALPTSILQECDPDFLTRRMIHARADEPGTNSTKFYDSRASS